MSEESELKAELPRKKGARQARYFEAPVDEAEVKRVKFKKESQQKFEGEVIQVDQHKPRRFKYKKKPTTTDDPSKSVSKKPPKISPALQKKYTRGEKVDAAGVKTNFFKAKQQRKEIYLQYATEQSARTELLQHEEKGFIEPDDDGIITANYTQAEICKNVDIQSAAKRFDLNMEFGPYSMRYTKNGRHLLLGGKLGHVAAFDWVTKKLLCEMSVQEEVADVAWLHVNTMFACAQKKWVYFYDNQGTELHCIKRLNSVNRMEFLPYHFLLATGNNTGYASWVDVSIGELVGNFNTGLGDIRLMRHNPGNGVLCIGGGKGVVSMWSPKVREPLAKLLCHPTPISALTVDPKGLHLVTGGHDHQVKIWDVRSLTGPLAIYKLHSPANNIEVSQRGVIAFGHGSYCQLHTNLLTAAESKTPYLTHRCGSLISGMRFCPYEDVLGIATERGFQSLLVPGSGEPNYDAYEDNPFQNKKQRREHEVHALLEKIPAELIALDGNEIAGVDVPTLQEKIDRKREIFHIKPPQINMKTRHKMKGRGGTAKAARNKQIVKDQKRKEFIADVRQAKREIIKAHKIENAAEADFIPLQSSKPTALDRFVPKQKRKT